MKACVTGATGFLGAHVARLLDERGDEVRVVYRDPDKLALLSGVSFKRSKADVLDFDMCRAVRGSDVLFHTAGYVASSPAERVLRPGAAPQARKLAGLPAWGPATAPDSSSAAISSSE